MVCHRLPVVLDGAVAERIEGHRIDDARDELRLGALRERALLQGFERRETDAAVLVGGVLRHVQVERPLDALPSRVEALRIARGAERNARADDRSGAGESGTAQPVRQPRPAGPGPPRRHVRPLHPHTIGRVRAGAAAVLHRSRPTGGVQVQQGDGSVN